LSLEALNDHFAIDGHLTFMADENGLIKASISNVYADAEVYLFGGHITHFQPKGRPELLWLSPDALFEPPKAIRGGVPICWPWFGKDPVHLQRAQHGFVRNRHWKVIKSSALSSGETRLHLQIVDDEETKSLWPYAFRLELCITVGERLRMELTSTNTDNKAYTIGGALHTYFRVDDITGVKVSGLESVTYIDTTDDYTKKTSSAPITIDAETDRIYLDTKETCVILDGPERKIEVTKEGSATTVVWNPWVTKAKAMQDFSDDGYLQMLCIESVNTLEDSIHLKPGESHTLTQSITSTI